ncbi:TetR/AcrR family transcriptional regulator [Hydrogenophaga palleronii]|uniref:TetR/AcrR family transcriptional regulator n=1 Tax=Hydrogenophaga palleronii TaxID=65655 RepID=UPI0008252686|nr:TetR/AcrR family transcriptional regulator [Hydrogenophaga palleronii]
MDVPPVTRTRKFQTKAKTLDGQAQLRRRFIDAGKALLKESPEGAPSLRKVAEITGYSPSALYRYFATKADLMYAIREEHLDRSVAYARERIEGETNPTQRLRLGFEALVGFWVNNPDDFRHVYSYRTRQEAADTPKPLLHDKSSIQAARGFSVSLVRDFFQYHGIEPDDGLVNQFTDSIIVATHGVVAIPLGSPSLRYCPNEVMARATVQAFIASWTGFIEFIQAHRLTRQPTASQFLAYLDTVARLA